MTPQQVKENIIKELIERHDPTDQFIEIVNRHFAALEQSPVTGDVVEVSNDGTDWKKRIFLHKNGTGCTCVNNCDEPEYNSGGRFAETCWPHMRPISKPTSVEDRIARLEDELKEIKK